MNHHDGLERVPPLQSTLLACLQLCTPRLIPSAHSAACRYARCGMIIARAAKPAAFFQGGSHG